MRIGCSPTRSPSAASDAAKLLRTMASVGFNRSGTNEALQIGMNTDVMSHLSAADSD